MSPILPAFRLKRSDTRERVRSWVKEQFSHVSSERADTFIEAARAILKDAGIPGKELRREWMRGERSELRARFRDRVLEQVDDAPADRISEYALRLGVA